MNRIPLFLLATLSLFVGACGDSSAPASSDAAAQAEEAAEVVPEKASATAVCLWNEAGLRAAAGRGSDAKWVSSVNFGEVVTLTGEETKPEGDDKTYVEMILKGGAQGWSNSSLFAINAARAAAYGDIDLYKRPELTTFTGDQFEPGEIFAVMPDSEYEGWLEVYGKEKKKKGYIQENSRFTKDEIDVSVSIMLTQALAEKGPQKQKEALERIMNSSTFQSSALIGLVETALSNLKERAELPANQLYVTADKLNARAEMSTTSEVLFQIDGGAIGTIIERSPDMVEVNGNTDYWYLIEVDGQEGWVFGHHTSKALVE